MSELKDEAICTAHSSVECDKKITASYETPKRGCNLNLSSDNPYTSYCKYRIVIEVPKLKEIVEQPIEAKEIPIEIVPKPEYDSLDIQPF